MFIRKYWIPLSVLLIAIAAVSIYWTQTRPPKEPIVIYKPVEPLPKSERQTEAPVGDTSQGGHVHANGTWHDQQHDPTAESVDRPVLPPLQVQEIPKFVKPAPDPQHLTVAQQVAASGDVPDRAAFEAMSDEQLSELIVTSYEKTRELSPKMNNALSEWAKVVGDLTRHAKTREENDAILAENAHLVQPLRKAMESSVWEYQVHSLTGHRASKILNARFFIEARGFADPESLTDEFWATFWSDF